MRHLRLRAATEDDFVLAYTITEDAMRGYVEETWGDWDSDEQLKKHRANYTPETHKIILVDDEAVGFLAVEDLPSHIWLVKLYIVQKHRNHGIGSEILEGVLQSAKEKRKPVSLRVLKVNKRAQALYAKHGFKVTGETAERLFMASVA